LPKEPLSKLTPEKEVVARQTEYMLPAKGPLCDTHYYMLNKRILPLDVLVSLLLDGNLISREFAHNSVIISLIE
jgi:hypothetical protein